MNNEILKAKLEEVAELRNEHSISDISLYVKDNETVLTEEAVDYVLHALHEGIKLISNKEATYTPELPSIYDIQ